MHTEGELLVLGLLHRIRCLAPPNEHSGAGDDSVAVGSENSAVDLRIETQIIGIYDEANHSSRVLTVAHLVQPLNRRHVGRKSHRSFGVLWPAGLGKQAE